MVATVGAYIVDHDIGADIVVTGQLGESQRFFLGAIFGLALAHHGDYEIAIQSRQTIETEDGRSIN